MKGLFREIKRRFRFKRIRSRFVAAMILLSIPPLFVLGYLSNNIAKETLVQNHIGTNGEHLKTASLVTDLKLDNVIHLQRLILSNQELRRELVESASKGDPDVIGIRTAKRLETIISDYLIDMHNIESVCLFDTRFRSVCHGRSDLVSRLKPDRIPGTDWLVSGLLPDRIVGTDWYRKAVKAQGKELFFSYNVLGVGQSDTISSVKLLLEPDHFSLEPIGLLVVNIKKSLFAEVFNERPESAFLVLDDTDGRAKVVYHSRPVLQEAFAGNDLASLERHLQESGYIIGDYVNRRTGWIFLHVTKASELLRDSQRIGTVTALIASLIGLTALGFSVILSGTITRPLLQIKNMMIDWAKGKRDFDATFEADEIGTIGETFKSITKENEELSERLIRSQLKEKETELRALQAQINPHFLYNTLDSIYWMAVLHHHQDIAKMAVSLSESFKLSLNKGKETIPVFKELKHIDHYMTIQNIRYHNRFQYKKDIAPELMGKEILKLLLQPIVENAIYHGLEPKVGEGTIRLTGKMDKGEIVFTVEDDGVGIQDMELTEKGFGLQNIRERLLLYYGPTSSLTIRSEVDKGTVVEIRFREKKGEAAC